MKLFKLLAVALLTSHCATTPPPAPAALPKGDAYACSTTLEQAERNLAAAGWEVTRATPTYVQTGWRLQLGIDDQLMQLKSRSGAHYAAARLVVFADGTEGVRFRTEQRITIAIIGLPLVQSDSWHPLPPIPIFRDHICGTNSASPLTHDQ